MSLQLASVSKPLSSWAKQQDWLGFQRRQNKKKANLESLREELTIGP